MLTVLLPPGVLGSSSSIVLSFARITLMVAHLPCYVPSVYYTQSSAVDVLPFLLLQRSSGLKSFKIAIVLSLLSGTFQGIFPAAAFMFGNVYITLVIVSPSLNSPCGIFLSSDVSILLPPLFLSLSVRV